MKYQSILKRVEIPSFGVGFCSLVATGEFIEIVLNSYKKRSVYYFLFQV